MSKKNLKKNNSSMATKPTQHRQAQLGQQFFFETDIFTSPKQVLSDWNPGPLPSQAHSLLPDKCAGEAEI